MTSLEEKEEDGEELGSDRYTLTVPPVDPVDPVFLPSAVSLHPSLVLAHVRDILSQSKVPGSADSTFSSSNKSANASESSQVESSGLVTVRPLFNIS